MTYRVVIRPAAASEIADAVAWYDEQGAELGQAFLNQIEIVLKRTEAGPSRFPVVLGDGRRALVHRFPNAIYFRVRGTDIRVLAVVHQHRDPRTWKRRLS